MDLFEYSHDDLWGKPKIKPKMGYVEPTPIRKKDIEAVRKLFKRKSAVAQLKAKKREIRARLAENRARVELKRIKAGDRALKEARFREAKFKAQQTVTKIRGFFSKKKGLYD